MFWSLAFAQVTGEKNVGAENGIVHLVMNSDPLVKFILLILIGFSVVSWAIILFKWKQVQKAQADSQSFWANFSQAKSLQDIPQRGTRSGPLYEIFTTAADWTGRLQKSGRSLGDNRSTLVQKLVQTREEEIYKLEQFIIFLATTASTAPYIGLFGTVWGILTAFWAIGQAGSSSLATVGPFISEALVATAVGLAAAIPAAMAYNYFNHKIKVLIKMMDLFLDDLVLRLEEEARP